MDEVRGASVTKRAFNSLTVRGVPCSRRAYRVVLLFSIVWVGWRTGQTVPTAARIEVDPAGVDDARAVPGRGGSRADPAGHADRRLPMVSSGAWSSDWARRCASRRKSPSSTAPRRRRGSRWPRPRSRKSGALKGNRRIRGLQAQLEAAQARVELAQLELDRCTLRAPFAGLVAACRSARGNMCSRERPSPSWPMSRASRRSCRSIAATATARCIADGAGRGARRCGKVQAILPLPEQFVALRELATPFAAAWVVSPMPRASWSRDCGCTPRPFRSAASPRFPSEP